MKPAINQIIFEITQNCNLNCKYCYNIWKRPNNKIYLENSYEKARGVLKKIFKQVKIKNIVFSGGEPFLSERFLELVLMTRLKNINVSIISNGTIATEQNFQYLIDLKIDVFELPFLSYNPLIHDSITQVKGSWEKSFSSIKTILKLGGNLIAVIVLTAENVNEIDKTIMALKKLGVNQIMLNRYNIGGMGIRIGNEIIPNIKDLHKTFETANNLVAKENLLITSNVCTPYCILNPEKYPNIPFSECSDDLFDKPITIELNGNVRMCNHSPNILGNISENNLYDIITKNNTKTRVKNIPDYCSKCNVYYKCLGGCNGASEQLGINNPLDPIIGYYSLCSDNSQ